MRLASRLCVGRAEDSGVSEVQTVSGTYTFGDYMQAIVDAGAHAQSNGTRVTSPGLSYEVANSTAAIPSTQGQALLAILSSHYPHDTVYLDQVFIQ